MDAHLEYCNQNLTPQQVLRIAGTAAFHVKRIRNKGGDGGSSSDFKRRLFFKNKTCRCPKDLRPLLTDFPNLVRCAPTLDERFFSIDRNSPAVLAREYPKRVISEERVWKRAADHFWPKVCAQNTIRARLSAAREKMVIRKILSLVLGAGSTSEASSESGSPHDLPATSSQHPHENFRCVAVVDRRKNFVRCVSSVRNRKTGLRVEERRMSKAERAAISCALERQSKARAGLFLKYRPILHSRLRKCIFLDWPVRQEKATPAPAPDNKLEKHPVLDRRDSKFGDDAKERPADDVPPVPHSERTQPTTQRHPREHTHLKVPSKPCAPLSKKESPGRKPIKLLSIVGRFAWKESKAPEKCNEGSGKSRPCEHHSDVNADRRVRVHAVPGPNNDLCIVLTSGRPPRKLIVRRCRQTPPISTPTTISHRREGNDPRLQRRRPSGCGRH
ncbi:hypothetical protein HK102_008964 [Quaeritorhiza haematococci]|nr:hypothetical protein HK102_008964 [Quaeritorhiza haematococci]